MKYLSFRILFLCVLLPPVLYILSIQGLEIYFQSTWNSGLRNHLVSNMDEIIAGETRITEAIDRNIDAYFRKKWPVRLGADPQVVVRTREGRLLYPALDFQGISLDSQGFTLKAFPSQEQKSTAAKRNLDILREGLVVGITVQIPRNTWLANIVLVFYILAFISVLFSSYQSRAKQAEQVARKQREDLEYAQERLEQAQLRLEEATEKEAWYQQEIDRLKEELAKADSRIQATEEEAVHELEELERRLQESVEHRERKEKDIQSLLQEVEHLEDKQKDYSRKRDRELKQVKKRFQTLYKHLKLHDRAVEGYLELPQDMHLKAEEVLHCMNEDSGKVQIKRKVFFKKLSLTVFETAFAYKGRIYWRKEEQGKLEVFAIGTKNTQNSDLNYLENISR